MFVQNQISSLQNHKDIILAQIDRADEMFLVVAYVRESGVDAILDKIQGKQIKLLCSFDMGITQLSGIRKLLENRVEVRVYTSNKGTFHPKIWLFRHNQTWKMLLGSANLTHAALVDNVEASVLLDEQKVTETALTFFNYLWNGEHANPVKIADIKSLQNKINQRKAFRDKSIKPQLKDTSTDDTQKADTLFEYVKAWIDMPKFRSRGISSLWRGWYIIPDQGHVSDAMISNLKSYLSYIGSEITIDKKGNDKYDQLLVQFKRNNPPKRIKIKSSPHELFVRQAKNYLLKFGWCEHPVKLSGKLDKTTLCLTTLGQQIDQCEDIQCVNQLYTKYFLQYTFNGLHIVKFSKHLLQRLGYLSLNEFDYFVTHAYNEDDREIIVDLIEIYRTLVAPAKFDKRVSDYFKRVKEPTAKNVRGNYLKSIRHTISAIAWCRGFTYDNNFTLRLDHADSVSD